MSYLVWSISLNSVVQRLIIHLPATPSVWLAEAEAAGGEERRGDEKRGGAWWWLGGCRIVGAEEKWEE